MTGFGTQNQARRAAPTGSSPLDPERLLAGIEPELNEVINQAVDRVAEIERTAVQQAQQVVARSERDARDTYGSTLDRSAELISRLELLAATLTDMGSAMRAETEAVMQSLRDMRESLSHWPPPSRRSEHEATGPSGRSAPDLAAAPEPDVEPSAELTQVFREQVTRMREEGKPRDEAERVLLRFRLGHRFLGMLDEIYSEPRANDDSRRSGLIGRLRSR